MRRRAQDDRQAESLYIVAAAVMFTVATLVSQWSWILLGEVAFDNALALWVLVAHVVVGAALAWVGLWGWKPEVAITAEAEALEIGQGDEMLWVACEDIGKTERITAEGYHQHWRRYASTRVFVNRMPDELLLLRTASGPVILGLTPADLDALEAHLARWLEAESVESLVRAA